MKKSKLTVLFVLTMAAIVPQTVGARNGAVPASAESAPGAAKPAGKPIALADNAPGSYTVVKGDTLWDIAGRFLKEPWRWPEIWNMNREQIKDPHWIYPGDVINLSFDADGRPVLSVGGSADGSGRGGFAGTPGSTVKLVPQVRVDRLSAAIPSIPARVIGPFLSLPMVVEAGGMDAAPKIIAAEDNRVVIGAGNTAYAAGISPNQGIRWQIYRPGKELVDPVTREVLGIEAVYVGDSRVVRFGESSTLEIIRSNQEIYKGDRLTPTIESTLPSYSPRAPEKALRGAVVSVLGSVEDAAQYSIVAVSLGKREGVEVGHVLASLQRGLVVSTQEGGGLGRGIRSVFRSLANSGEPAVREEAGIASEVKLPDERNGLIFIFRVFDKVSYGLVMSSKRPMKVGDVVQTP